MFSGDIERDYRHGMGQWRKDDKSFHFFPRILDYVSAFFKDMSTNLRNISFCS